MYEHLRNDLLSELSSNIDSEILDYFMATLDKVVANYTISRKETSLAVVDDETTKLVKIYLASKKLEGCSDNTIKFYAGRLKIFFNTIQHKPDEIQPSEIRVFLAQYQLQNGVSNRTLDKFREVINGFFAWCVNEDYLIKNPCKNTKRIKYEVVPRTSLTRYQLENLRRECKTKRELAIVDVLYSTGVRVSELINMKFSDINNDTIHIVGKGKKHNTVYLNANAKLSLEEYIKVRKGNSDYIFVQNKKPYDKLSKRTVERILKRVGNELGYKVHPHTIRHTTATIAIENGMPITQVQKMLGHSSINTTQIYVDVSQADIAEAHKKYVI